MIKNNKENSILQIFFCKMFEKVTTHKIFLSVSVVSFLILTAITYFIFLNNQNFSALNLADFEIGRVAERDVIANRDISYVDKEATKIRIEAKKHLVNPVFINDSKLVSEVVNSVLEFTTFVNEKYEQSSSLKDFVFLVQEKFPKVISEEDLAKLYNNNIDEQTGLALTLIKDIMSRGIIEYPESTISDYNSSEITVVTKYENKQEFENRSIEKLLTIEEVPYYVKSTLRPRKKADLADGVMIILMPFIKGNILYDSEETARRVDAAVQEVPPVSVTIHKNQKIIRQGFIISEDNYSQLKNLTEAGRTIDIRLFIGYVLFFLCVWVVALFLFSNKIIGVKLVLKEQMILLFMAVCTYMIVLLSSQFRFITSGLDLAVLMPIAIFVLLLSILISQKVAVVMTCILSLTVLGASSFNFPIFLYALFSGLAGVAFINITGQRLDLIKTACILTVFNPLILFILIMTFPGFTSDRGFVFIGTAINGFLTGIFVLGFLPILEATLNIATSFRLMELSDLNSSLLKKMLLTVPGTYNHSIMVASLAESACRDIGANPLLARVGAYYHDIGKMENPEYFIENQGEYNKHVNLNPRLSATVIRSHLKLGVEKARQMRLPESVIDIIAEHHGNSLIEYFYNEARKEDPNVDPEDFSYPGKPPRTKESAVVMLADTVEAACRTLEKPSVSSLEKFIAKLVKHKIEIGQLDNSDLTFKEVTIIKESFLGILAGYYHSRIEYQNQNSEDDIENNQFQEKYAVSFDTENESSDRKGGDRV